MEILGSWLLNVDGKSGLLFMEIVGCSVMEILAPSSSSFVPRQPPADAEVDRWNVVPSENEDYTRDRSELLAPVLRSTPRLGTILVIWLARTISVRFAALHKWL